MRSLVIELPARPDQTEYNLRRWKELLDDPELARIEGRIAKEVWVCSLRGEMTFYGPKSDMPLTQSKLCPKFPKKVTLSV